MVFKGTHLFDLFRSKKLKQDAACILNRLHFLDKLTIDGWVFQTIPQLIKLTGRTDRTVRNRVQELVDLGFVEKKMQRNKFGQNCAHFKLDYEAIAHYFGLKYVPRVYEAAELKEKNKHANYDQDQSPYAVLNDIEKGIFAFTIEEEQRLLKKRDELFNLGALTFIVKDEEFLERCVKSVKNNAEKGSYRKHAINATLTYMTKWTDSFFRYLAPKVVDLGIKEFNQEEKEFFLKHKEETGTDKEFLEACMYFFQTVAYGRDRTAKIMNTGGYIMVILSNGNSVIEAAKKRKASVKKDGEHNKQQTKEKDQSLTLHTKEKPQKLQSKQPAQSRKQEEVEQSKPSFVILPTDSGLVLDNGYSERDFRQKEQTLFYRKGMEREAVAPSSRERTSQGLRGLKDILRM